MCRLNSKLVSIISNQTEFFRLNLLSYIKSNIKFVKDLPSPLAGLVTYMAKGKKYEKISFNGDGMMALSRKPPTNQRIVLMNLSINDFLFLSVSQADLL